MAKVATCDRCHSDFDVNVHGHCPACCIVEDHDLECTNWTDEEVASGDTQIEW